MSEAAKKKDALKGDAASSLPMFFKKPKALTLETHKKAGMATLESLGFAKITNTLPLTSAEFKEAAKHYPIVFTEGENIIPVVVVGLEKENIYVDKKGKWEKGAYIPAYVRKYPFVFLELPEKNELVLCVDEACEAFTADAKGSDRKFYDGEEPTEFIKNTLEFCKEYQGNYAASRRFCDRLKELDLLTPSQYEVKLEGDKQIRLAGFQTINPEKLSKLSDEDIAELHKNHGLPMIYFALQSQSNWQRLAERT